MKVQRISPRKQIFVVQHCYNKVYGAIVLFETVTLLSCPQMLHRVNETSDMLHSRPACCMQNSSALAIRKSSSGTLGMLTFKFNKNDTPLENVTDLW